MFYLNAQCFLISILLIITLKDILINSNYQAIFDQMFDMPPSSNGKDSRLLTG